MNCRKSLPVLCEFVVENERNSANDLWGQEVYYAKLNLAHQYDVLFLDEATSGPDPFSRNELLEIFAELRSNVLTKKER